MQQQNSVLELLGISQWAVRGAQIATPLPKRLVFLAETKQQFSAVHHEQLSKILGYLGLLDQCDLVYADSDLTLSAAELALSFGASLPADLSVALAPCSTFSVSEMINNPSCKRQVMNDIKVIKDYCA